MSALFPRERVERVRNEKWRQITARGDQIDNAVSSPVKLSPFAHNLSLLGIILNAMRDAHPTADSAADDPGFLPGVGLSVEHSSLAEGGGDLMPGVSVSELRSLHIAAQAVATDSVFGSTFLQLSTHLDLLFAISLGWTPISAAPWLLARRHGHGCTVCEYRKRAPELATGGVLVSCGAVTRVITVCDSCTEDLRFEYPSIDIIKAVTGQDSK